MCVSSKLDRATKAPKQRIKTFFMFSSFSFFRYGHQTADIKPFLKLTSARLFSQEPRKKLFLRCHETSLKIVEDKACKVPHGQKALSSQLLSRSSKHCLLVPALSHMVIKPDRFSFLVGWQYGRAEFQRRGLGRRGHYSGPKLGKKFPTVVSRKYVTHVALYLLHS